MLGCILLLVGDSMGHSATFLLQQIKFILKEKSKYMPSLICFFCKRLYFEVEVTADKYIAFRAGNVCESRAYCVFTEYSQEADASIIMVTFIKAVVEVIQCDQHSIDYGILDVAIINFNHALRISVALGKFGLIYSSSKIPPSVYCYLRKCMCLSVVKLEIYK